MIAPWQNVFDLNRPCRELSHSFRIATVACAMVVTACACLARRMGSSGRVVLPRTVHWWCTTPEAEALIATSPQPNVRPKEADLVALPQAGELDYIWSYESIAQATGLRYVTLPTQIDLSNIADSAMYAVAAVRIAGMTPTDTITLRGAPRPQ